jgi:phosphoglycolate phosphatase
VTPPYDAVLLDLDGTLSESGPAIVAAVSAALQHLGRDPLDELVLRSFIGPPLETSFAALPGFDDALIAEATRVYRENYDLLGPPLYDGVVPLLEALRAAGLRVSLATSKPEPLALEIVTDKGLLHLLDAVCGAGPDAERTSKADIVGKALQRLGRPERPVMVGDRHHDVAGAAAHGVPCVGVLWGYGDADELLDAGAVALAHDVEGLRRILLTGAGTADAARERAS